MISPTVLTHVDPERYGQELGPVGVMEVHTEVEYLAGLVGGWRALEGGLSRFITRYLRRPSPLPEDDPLVLYLGLMRFRGVMLEEDEVVVGLCMKVRVGQSLALLRLVRRRIQEEERERERAKKREGGGGGGGGGRGSAVARRRR